MTSKRSPSLPDHHPSSADNFRRAMMLVAALLTIGIAYVLRGVLVPLFFAFLLAYALDPLVDRIEAIGVPRTVGALAVMAGILALFVAVLVFAVPHFLQEIRDAAADFPSQLASLEARAEPWLWTNFKIKLPHTMNELVHTIGDKFSSELPSTFNAAALALFGTLGYVAVGLSALIVPVFALYLLIDFDRIVARAADLVPRRYSTPVAQVAKQIHRTLGSWVRGQLTANIVLGALYALGLRMVDIRLAVPIGVFTGMLAFVPYIGFFCGLFLALAMAILDWQGLGTVLGVLVVMGGVQLLDGLVITPRIVGKSVGLTPLEVLITMMAAASVFGFFGVLLAVPLGATIKIIVRRGVKAYMGSAFYRRPEDFGAT
jgi:predicted PurR-regulated permease PerM